jgi:hypothetical protein
MGKSLFIFFYDQHPPFGAYLLDVCPIFYFLYRSKRTQARYSRKDRNPIKLMDLIQYIRFALIAQV